MNCAGGFFWIKNFARTLGDCACLPTYSTLPEPATNTVMRLVTTRLFHSRYSTSALGASPRIVAADECLITLVSHRRLPLPCRVVCALSSLDSLAWRNQTDTRHCRSGGEVTDDSIGRRGRAAGGGRLRNAQSREGRTRKRASVCVVME